MDDIARSILSMELPLGVVTSIMGAPFLFISSFNEGGIHMLLEINELYGGYGHGDIVKGVTFHADQGEILCLIGLTDVEKPLCSDCF